ncbi:MAG: DUF4149 domain-containing protein [SAR324 cluster bacterium]|nr:DUF4149 domain-containing protein [SAR324 cluster bacterium]
MKNIFPFLYQITLSLWLGGMVAIGFVATPPLFKNLGIDKAAEVTGLIFPIFFPYCLVLTILARFLFGLAYRDVAVKSRKWILGLLVGSIVLAAVQHFFIFPKAEALRDQVGVFADTLKTDPVRKQFGMYHGISNGVNLLLMLSATGLIYLTPRKEEEEEED